MSRQDILGGYRYRLGTCLFIATLISGRGLSTVASAHIPSTGETVGLRFPVVVAASAVIGAVGGFAVVASHSRGVDDWVGDRRLVGGLGLILSGLAVIILLPIAPSQPLLSGGCVVFGGVVAVMLPVHTDSHHTDGHVRPSKATSTAGALTAHQFLEGLILAAGYVAGGAVGVIAAIVLTVHTVAETAAVGGAYVLAGQHKRGVAAVVAMQAVYVVAASVAFTTTLSISPFTEHLITAVVAGVLLVVGIHECRCSFYGFVA